MTREEKLAEIAAIVREYDPEYGPLDGEIAGQIMMFLETGVSPRKPRNPMSPEKVKMLTQDIARDFVNLGLFRSWR